MRAPLTFSLIAFGIVPICQDGSARDTLPRTPPYHSPTPAAPKFSKFVARARVKATDIAQPANVLDAVVSDQDFSVTATVELNEALPHDFPFGNFQVVVTRGEDEIIAQDARARFKEVSPGVFRAENKMRVPPPLLGKVKLRLRVAGERLTSIPLTIKPK
ncbi:MAG: hypothetical protein IT428_25845 [Planctomycetaceae bacterium]|nr:hypothetical protein [Planctomycetaceae bacterium]